LDDIINHFSQISAHNCSYSHEERKKLLDKEIDKLFEWAEDMTEVSHFTYRSTTPANAAVNPKVTGYQSCWGKDCAHMNQLIKIVNNKMYEVYTHNASSQVNYLDGWALLGGFCPTEACNADGHMRCYTSRYAEYDDWYHSAYLAYVQIAPWLEHVCQKKNNTSAVGSYIS
jgi:hypothetical protein